MTAIDAGAEDVETESGFITVYTPTSSFEKVRAALEGAGVSAESAEVTMRPTNTIHLEGDQARKVVKLVEALEDLDDVQKVHANFDVPEEILETA